MTLPLSPTMIAIATAIVFAILAIFAIFMSGKSKTPTVIGDAEPPKQDENAVVFYYAEWCGSCQALKPLLEEAKKSPKLAGITIKEVDTDKEWSPESIVTVPTLVKGGKVYNNEHDVEKMIEFIANTN